jgi:transcriptional regulator with XRE-family HTH domain
MAFTDNLQALMSAKGISRRRLAKECGISPSAVNSWFNRSSENISLQTLKKLSEYFGISIEELVHGRHQRSEIAFSSSAYTDEELDQIQRFAHFLIGQRGKG